LNRKAGRGKVQLKTGSRMKVQFSSQSRDICPLKIHEMAIWVGLVSPHKFLIFQLV